MEAFQRLWGTPTFDSYIDALKAKKTTPNGIFGSKVLWGQLFAMFEHSDPRHAFPDLRFVFVSRRDHIRQAVSFARATQTEEWASTHPSRGVTPTYDIRQIDELLAWIERDEESWEHWFTEREVTPLRIEYEELANAPEAPMLRVLDFLEVDLPPGLAVASPTIQRQADDLSEQWVERYRRERATGP